MIKVLKITINIVILLGLILLSCLVYKYGERNKQAHDDITRKLSEQNTLTQESNKLKKQEIELLGDIFDSLEGIELQVEITN